MNWTKQMLKDLVRADQAATAVEYAVLLASIILVCVAAIQRLGDTTTGLFEMTRDNMPN